MRPRVLGDITPGSEQLAKLTPELVCRNLPPLIQKWFQDQKSDCSTLPPDVLLGVARCALSNKLFDAASEKCFNFDGTPDVPAAPIPVPAPKAEEPPPPPKAEEPSVLPWVLMIGAAFVGAVLIAKSQGRK